MIKGLDASRWLLLAALVWAPIASGAVHGWSLAVTQLLVLAAVCAWMVGMVGAGRLAWRATALGLPVALLLGLVAIQLALGNRPLRAWALAAPAPASDGIAALPDRFLTLGTVAPVRTLAAVGVFLTYAAVYVLVVNLVTERRHLERLVAVLLTTGALLAFAALLEYRTGEQWLMPWGERQEAKRLSGPFTNANHFASWLTMIVCLGIGFLAGSRGRRGEALSFAAVVASRRLREQWMRRFLPFLGVVVAALAIVFTLSRGGILSLLAALLAMLFVFNRVGWTRRSVALAGAFVTMTGAYAAWIGLGPLVARLGPDESRWLLTRATLPMLRDFPLFGVGLGAFKDIFFRYQTADLQPGRVYYGYAHNDLLQLVVEVGLIGAALAGWAVWRVGRDLLGAHLFGRGVCPVGGGAGEEARRHDPFSVGVGVGALGAVVAFLTHCLVEFPARIPAAGLLASACLGIATVALHTRFDRTTWFLTKERAYPLGEGRRLRIAVAVVTVGLAVALVPWIMRPVRIEAALAPREGRTPVARVTAALAIAGNSPEVLLARAERRVENAQRVWAPVPAAGSGAPSIDEQRRVSVEQLEAAISDLDAYLEAIPSDPFAHERLGWAYGLLASIDPARAAEHVPFAVTHLRRAVALAPENPFLHRSLAALALTRPGTLLETAFAASRAAVARDPGMLPSLVQRFDTVGLTDAQWLAVVPDAWPDRLELGWALENGGRPHAAVAVYRGAIAVAPSAERVVGTWLLARALIRAGDPRQAVAETERALAADPQNPELLLLRADALAAVRDPAALDLYRAAVDSADARARAEAGAFAPFKVSTPRVAAVVAARLAERASGSLQYRRALARYLTERRLWELATREWQMVLAAQPRDAEGQFLLGMSLDAFGARDRAVEAYRRAVELDNRPAFRLRLAQALWDTEQYFQAMNEWRAVIDREPTNLEAHLGLARAHAKAGDRAEAFRGYQRVLKIAPDHVLARQEANRLGGR